MESYTSSSDIRSRLFGIVVEKHLTKHPYYKLWDEGKLTKFQLKEYSRQYYHLEFSFPRYLSAIHSKCEDAEIRRNLVQNMYEEEVEGTPHAALWRQFEEALGVEESKQTNAVLLAETEATISTLKNLCNERSVAEGIASLYAYEAMLPEVSKRKIEGLKRHYGISDPKSLEFFSVHVDADSKHSSLWLDLLEKQSSIPQHKLDKAALDTCNALNLFLDGIMKAYVM